MRKLLTKVNRDYLVVLTIFLIYKLFLLLVERVISPLIPLREGYLGPIHWANFDGLHYLSIAKNGYYQYEEAFFPLFPLTIKLLSEVFKINYAVSGVFIVHASGAIALYFLFKLVRLDYDVKASFWIIVFFLAFPTAFFLSSLYSESLFLALTLSSVYFARRAKWFMSGVLGGFASATRLVGIFLLPALIVEYVIQRRKGKKSSTSQGIKTMFGRAWGVFVVPLGLLGYVSFLTITNNDPLSFIRAQPAFGAGRSGGEIILLPQVFFRYVKIFLTVSMVHYDYWIAVLEMGTFLLIVWAIYLAYRSGARLSYILFSLLSILLPTLSGTLSSIPRYSLSVFVVFTFFGTIKNAMIRVIVAFIFFVIQAILVAFFLRGHFVS